MELTISSRIKNAWNTFRNKNPAEEFKAPIGVSYSYRPDRPRYTGGRDKSIITSLFTRIALDVATLDFKHVELNDDDAFIKEVDSELNNCLKVEANIDQTGRAFMQDVVMSMLDEGVVAIVPVDTTIDPNQTNSYDILSMRTGKIINWYPQHVKVRLYNENTGRHEDILLSKHDVGIVENPFYALINERNSVNQRLIRKLALIDITDERVASGKLDLVVQLPYTIKGEARRAQANERRKELEDQLANSKYGIGYIDGTEHITQLNRSVENNLLKNVEYLQSNLFSQLGMTQAILDGTADEQTMLNYYSRTIEPIANAIIDEMTRKFLTRTARSQHKAIRYFRDPFKLIPVGQIAEIADKFTRNEVLTSNEIRQKIGVKPSKDPKADQLINSNISQPAEEARYPNYQETEDSQNE